MSRPHSYRPFHTASTNRSQQQPPSSSTPTYTYSLAASFSAKGARLQPARDFYTFNPYHHIEPNPKAPRLDSTSRPQSGQDAFFISNIGSDTHNNPPNTASLAFGVVDGVGGWTTSGVDPADFAHGLCEYMAAAATSYPSGFKSSGPTGVATTHEQGCRPRALLKMGVERVMDDASIFAGGSTACLATLDAQGRLEVANLGDSGFVHLAPRRVRYVEKSQTHGFNTPYQLSKLPRQMARQMAVFGGGQHYAESAEDANVSVHGMAHGDVVVFATDGVWDNLSPEDALRIVDRVMGEVGAWVETEGTVEVGRRLRYMTHTATSGMEKGEMSVAARLAMAVTKEAKEASLNTKRDGPFAKEVQRLYPGENWRGGKADDICCVVAVAVEDQAPDTELKAKL